MSGNAQYLSRNIASKSSAVLTRNISNSRIAHASSDPVQTAQHAPWRACVLLDGAGKALRSSVAILVQA